MNLNKKVSEVYSRVANATPLHSSFDSKTGKKEESSEKLNQPFFSDFSESLAKNPPNSSSFDKDGFLKTSQQDSQNIDASTKLEKLTEDSSLRRVAKFLVLIGIDEAAKIMSRLSPEQAEKIAYELTTIRGVDKDEATLIFAEFGALAKKAQHPVTENQGGVETAQTFLEAAFGKERAAEILKRAVPDLDGKPFDYLTELDTERLQVLLKDESIAVYSLVLTQVPPQLAASVIKVLPQDKKALIIKRLAKMQKIDTQVLRQIDKTLREKAKHIDMTSSESIDGRSALSEILRQMNPQSEQKLLASLAERDPDLGEDMRSRMFTFDDLANADTKWLQNELRKMSDSDIALLIMSKEEKFRTGIFSSISKSRGAMVLEEESFLGTSSEVRASSSRMTKQFLQRAKNAWIAGDLIIMERDEYV